MKNNLENGSSALAIKYFKNKLTNKIILIIN